MITGSRLARSTIGGVPVLSAELASGPDGRPHELWIRSEHLTTAVTWDPFVPTLALLAASRGTELRLEGPASPALLRQVVRAQRVWHDWAAALNLPDIRPVACHATVAPARPRAFGAAGFFSGGVDSFYTLLSNHRRYPAGDPRRLRYLLLVHGLDIAIENVSLFSETRAAVEQVAAALSVQTIIIETNIRSVVDGIDWAAFAHAPCLVAGALAATDLFDTVFVPAAYAADELKPNAVHPVLDPLWSTEYLDVVHHGLEASRGDKVDAIAGSAVALQHLRVCWENRGNAYNCGRCEKCLRTMLDLWVAGALGGAETFPRAFDEIALTSVTVPPHLISFWETGIARAREAGRDPAVIEMLRRTILRSAFDRTNSGRIMNAVMGLTRTFGVTPAQVKSLDDRLTGGTAQRAFRRLQGRPSKPH